MKPEIDYTLYLVTDRDLMSTPTLEQAVEQAILGGVTLVQLREKQASSLEFYQTARRIKRITEKYSVPLIINDRVDIALAVDAEGVHVGQSDLPAARVREIIGPDKILGVSTSLLEEALQAEKDGADYLGVGAMFATGTKTDARPVTMAALQEIRERVKIPIVTIGGINQQTMPLFAGTGIDGVAVVSALIAAEDITAAAREMKADFLSTRKLTIPDFEAAIFDLDGTLIDSMGVWEKIDRDFLAKRNLAAPEDYIAALSAMGFRRAADYTISRFNLPDSAEEILLEWHRMSIDEYGKRIFLKPHVKPYLEQLKDRGVHLGIATALPRALYEPVLKNNGVYEYFDAIASTDEVGRGKEAPDVYLLAAKKLGTDPSACIAFEDIPSGIAGILAAGMRAYGVYDQSSHKERFAIRKIANGYLYDFAQLL